jgi:heme-degrading monooxygenase HmoA
MIVEYIRYEIPEAEAQEFIEAYRSALSDVDASEHSLGYELTRGVEEPRKFTVRLLWDSVEGHEKGFRSSPQFKSFLPKIRKYIGAIQEMKHYEVLESKSR